MPSSEIRELCTARDRAMAYRLRFETYCQKLQWIDPALHPHGMECDPYDPFSTHFGAFEEDNLVGTIRLIKKSPLPFPIETAFPKATAEDLEVQSLEGVALGEVSRLIVDSLNNCPRHAISLGLLQVLIRNSVHGELTHWLQALDKVSFRLIKWFGFRMKRFAPSKHFLGSETIPTVIRIDRCFEEFQLHNPPLFEFMSSDIEPSCVADHAAAVIERMGSM